MMLKPVSRNAPMGLLTRGGSMWFSQGCSIGCQSCNESAPIPWNTGGDLCPEDNTGNKTPSLNLPYHRTSVVSDPTGEGYTKFHPWRAPGSVSGYDPCGVAGGDHSGRAFPAGGFGYTTGYEQGYPGSKLPEVPHGREVWKAGNLAEVSWVSTANHGGGYQYSLCPAGPELSESCFNAMPLEFHGDMQKLRYIYLNQTDNMTEVQIPATRVSEGVLPAGSTWTKNPIPAGNHSALNKSMNPHHCGGAAANYMPQFEPPSGCDDHCWGYQPCNVFWIHPSYEGWEDHNNPPCDELPPCAPANGEGCCHTLAYMEVIDDIRVPDVPAGDYVLRWRWDAEQSPQIWSNCADVTIVNELIL